MNTELIPEKIHGAKIHAVIRVTYRIPDSWRGRLFWRLLDVILWIGGAE